MSPTKLLDNPFKEIRLLIENYISIKKKAIMAERTKFVSVAKALEISTMIF